ncbi:GspE/PulE family protein [Thermoactinomyces mirandus]|uniref:Type II/IV secretion system protein n=1 Tax=Thermoactinomyces mirandus TaxID=2756294 RepID=A0A7W1XUH3_9BACL|nr:GspE/PulE family protein [Thermoactinomyces mirandus]MBA4603465.1 type II/IV secretion system protein [Thermoactinomyces mirandus]
MDVASYIDQLLYQAVRKRASDIHIEPQRDEIRIRLRIDGQLLETGRLDYRHLTALVSRIKVMSQLDIGEKRLPQDGTFSFGKADQHLQVRISTLPTIYGEKVVMRLLRLREKYNMGELGLESEQQQKINRLLGYKSGLLVVTGPTGSGKTTTLYTLLQVLNSLDTNIISLEDPVELQLEGVNQVQIHPKTGLTYSSGLKAVMRQDPNVIMIGEIRDEEIANIAISAALTGHLVLTTLHTADAASAVIRLLDLKIEPYRLAAALIGVIAQRLVRLLCHECNGKGCTNCQQSGYQGRIGVFEVMEADRTLAELILKQVSLEELREQLAGSGMKSINDMIRHRIKKGQTTIDEWMRVVDGVEEETLEGRAIHGV